MYLKGRLIAIDSHIIVEYIASSCTDSNSDIYNDHHEYIAGYYVHMIVT